MEANEVPALLGGLSPHRESLLPIQTGWVVSICSTNGGCSSPGDTDVMLNFPLAGFQVGDVHPLTSKKTLSFATPYWLMGVVLCIIIH
jgi:hypothetical protein